MRKLAEISLSKKEGKVFQMDVQNFVTKILNCVVLICYWCNTNRDTIVHRYFNCSFIQNVWFSLIKKKLSFELLFHFKELNFENQVWAIGLFWTILFQIHKTYFYNLSISKTVSISDLIKRCRNKGRDE